MLLSRPAASAKGALVAVARHDICHVCGDCIRLSACRCNERQLGTRRGFEVVRAGLFARRIACELRPPQPRSVQNAVANSVSALVQERRAVGTPLLGEAGWIFDVRVARPRMMGHDVEDGAVKGCDPAEIVATIAKPCLTTLHVSLQPCE